MPMFSVFCHLSRQIWFLAISSFTRSRHLIFGLHRFSFLLSSVISLGIEINISRQWTIGPQALEIWWSCQISGRSDFWVKSNTADRIYLVPYKTFEMTLHYIHFIEKYMSLVIKSIYRGAHFKNVVKNSKYCF